MNASPAQGTVQVQGTVKVNGNPVPDTTVIFGGDLIQTAAESTAAISAPGVMVQLEPNTTAIFTSHALDLGCGEVVVTGSVGTVVRVSGITVTPAAQNISRVRVSQMNGTVKVTALENWSVVNNGTIRQTLAPKQSVTFNRPGATCEVVVHTVAQGGTSIYLPLAAAAAGLTVLSYCTPNSFCREASPSGP